MVFWMKEANWSEYYHYRDARTVGTEVILEDTISLEKTYDITGIQFMNINPLNQLDG